VRLSIGAAACVLGLALADVASGEGTTPALGRSASAGVGKTRVKKRHLRKVLRARLTFAARADEEVEPLVIEEELPPVASGVCPRDMASIEQRYCIDKYEASLIEFTISGERPFSPFDVVDGRAVRAVSVPGVFPQGYISGREAQEACHRAHKRLCKAMEWRKACAGPSTRQYGYGETHERGRCNDSGRSPMFEIWHLGPHSARRLWDPIRMNDARLNQLPGSLARTGAHPSCSNEYGVFDMVGNLHEWVDDPTGTFHGGYYLDTSINGEGCGYRTGAHGFSYHDYSTGFRCCADLSDDDVIE
jgi:sulfatase modifying factor 1